MAEEMDETKRGEELFNKALTWCGTQAKKDGDAYLCPFCGWRSEIVKQGSTMGPLKGHMRGKHPAAVTVGFMHKDISAMEKMSDDGKVEDDQLEVTKDGVEILGNPYFNQLYVPSQVQARWKAEGMEGRWATRGRVQGYKDMGYRTTKRPEDVDMPLQHSTEDSTMRANEMVLVEAPAQLVKHRKEFKQAKVDHQLISRKEELDRALTNNAREIYDASINRGLSKTQANNLAEAAERGGLRIDRGRLNRG